jgi:hypothetical protein
MIKGAIDLVPERIRSLMKEAQLCEFEQCPNYSGLRKELQNCLEEVRLDNQTNKLVQTPANELARELKGKIEVNRQPNFAKVNSVFSSHDIVSLQSGRLILR